VFGESSQVAISSGIVVPHYVIGVELLSSVLRGHEVVCWKFQRREYNSTGGRVTAGIETGSTLVFDYSVDVGVMNLDPIDPGIYRANIERK
jgi:hypothetical protein